MAGPAPRIEHPNRQKAASKLTRLLVIVLLLASAGLMVIVSVAGWSAIAGAKPLQVVLTALYVVLAVFVARWSRGVLPVVAALATVLLIFAAVSAPAWFQRDGAGFTDPALPSELLGLLTALLVPLQILLIALAMSGFRQAWNVEVEHDAGAGDADRPRAQRMEPGGGPHTARA